MKNIKNKLFKGISLTSVLFVFQACYGTPQDFGHDFLVHGKVISSATDKPIKGIKVSMEGVSQYSLTDETGSFGFYAPLVENAKVIFEDIDNDQNGSYLRKDTVISGKPKKVDLLIKMANKE